MILDSQPYGPNENRDSLKSKSWTPPPTIGCLGFSRGYWIAFWKQCWLVLLNPKPYFTRYPRSRQRDVDLN
ncbi:hypothetical protein P152DRAFT_148088 [Eremomyces bilateralis CBS 781.70]|uniref:Uncharacterized protein n=1 Tax=Eremomyces bilateralis CBS 781.70 TaxID=1392243 RepID=A0A6G1FVU9_9PEZI|nr:uncharacterized protein P152DRAFT_148088 [Eremomyces bilateralis CBS 781.70]KAF1809759.1 hypothetical protein P152DRAFT_148088 [Eremomyces bilateralis CBS 781.70]